MLADRLIAREQMDDPALPESAYHAVLADLSRVNRATLAYRPTLDFLKRAVGEKSSFRLLDVGFGAGDMLRRIARWARARGISAELVGIDLNPRSEVAARERTDSAQPIRYLTGDYRSLAGERFDFIVSSLVAHHMDHAELVAFLGFMEAEARRGWFVNDLHRHGFGYRTYPTLARLLRVHPIVRHDGKMSIARSYRASEWTALLAEAGVTDARVRRYFPFRLCVEKLR